MGKNIIFTKNWINLFRSETAFFGKDDKVLILADR